MECERLVDLLRTHRHDDRMTSVVPSGASRAYIELRREDIDKFALPFIAPLRPEHHSGYVIDSRRIPQRHPR